MKWTWNIFAASSLWRSGRSTNSSHLTWEAPFCAQWIEDAGEYFDFVELTIHNFVYRTCRVRRKVSHKCFSMTMHLKDSPQKCDEHREDNSCKTCKRLAITCLGWGAKRPDWMRVSSSYCNTNLSLMTLLLVTGQEGSRRLQEQYQGAIIEVWSHPWSAAATCIWLIYQNGKPARWSLKRPLFWCFFLFFI